LCLNSTTRTADITERISQARKLLIFGPMNKQLLSNKIPIDIRRRLTLGKRKLGSERSKQIQTGSVPPWMSPQDVRADGVGCSQDTDQERQIKRMVEDSPTIDSLMETRRCRWLSKLSVMKQSRSPRRILGAWCTTSRTVPVGRPQQTIRHAYISTLKKIGFEGEKGQLREWMTVPRYRSAWGLNLSYSLLPTGSFTNLCRQ
jgi:hypothetical protein